MTLHLDWRKHLVGVSLTASKSLSPSTSKNPPPTSRGRTSVTLQQMEPGPQPDTAAFIQKMEQEKLAKQRGEVKDNRSFFAKYWMYIIPVVLVLAMGSNQEGQGGGGGR